MTLTDPVVDSIVHRYRTAEFATLTRDGTPIAWPTSALPLDDGTLIVTTSIALPQKALNVRRDGRVALLFSNPTASGVPDPAQVLLRGIATSPEEIHTTPEGDLARFWARIWAWQPSARAYLTPPATWLADWYFMRLIITVVPDEVTVAPLPAPAPATVVPGLLGSETIAGFDSAVLAARDRTGAPLLHRITVTGTPDGYRLALPSGTGAVAGPASLLVHQHDDQLADIRNAVVRGVLHGSASTGWTLVPATLIEPGARQGLRETVRTIRRSRAAARRYLARRHLARPRIPWARYRDLRPAG